MINRNATAIERQDILSLVGTAVPPALIAVISAFHPIYSQNANDSYQRIAGTPLWEPIHIALLVVILAFDFSLLHWKPFPQNKLSQLRTLGIWVNAGFYSAFIGVDGIASFVLSHLGTPSQATDAITSLFASPLVTALAWIGAAGWIITAVVIIRQRQLSGLNLGPSWLLLIGVVWLSVSHAPPFGVGAGILIASGAVWASFTKIRP